MSATQEVSGAGQRAGNFDEHGLSTLTEDERKALLEAQADGTFDHDGDDDGEEKDEGSAAPAAAAPAPVAAPAPAEAGTTAKPKGEATPPAATTAPTEEPAPAAAAEVVKPTAKAQPQPVTFTAELPADYDAQVKAIGDDKAALSAKLREGEIDVAEYQVQMDAINDRRLALAEAKMKADLARDMSQQSAEAMWKQTVESFIAENPKNGGIDYAKNRTANVALDAYVRQLANDPNNNDKSMLWFLEKADSLVEADLSFVRQKPAAPETPPAVAKPNAEPAAASRKPPISAAPTTLAPVPGGQGPGDPGHEGEFDAVLRLSGEALELAVAKMTTEQRERFAKAY